ncbi:MAG TPA: alpha/beta hydrolase [Devosiaceae bacterium]
MNLVKPFAASADGTSIHATDMGRGRPIVILHGGMQAAARWDDVAQKLRESWRLVAIERRLYGRSGEPRSPHAIAREVEDTAAVLSAIGEPALLLGHSSGGMVALEASLEFGDRLAGLILYEPPLQRDTPFGGDDQARMEAAMASGDRDEALRIFFTDIIEFDEPTVTFMRTDPAFAGAWGDMKRLAPAQMADTNAIRALPLGLDRYAAIDVPTLLLKGDQSPRHLQDGMDALQPIIAGSMLETFVGHGHSANLEAPDEMAAVMDRFAKRLFGK